MARRIHDALRDGLSFTDNPKSGLFDVARAREENRFASLAGIIEKPSVVGLLWSLTGPDMYRRLGIKRGWSPDRYETELGKPLIHTLLAWRDHRGRIPMSEAAAR